MPCKCARSNQAKAQRASEKHGFSSAFTDNSFEKLLDPRGFRDQNAGPDPGWLVAAGGSKKKNGHHQFFCSLRPVWALMIMEFQLYTTQDSKGHKKCKSRVKFITNITPNWSTWFAQAGKNYLWSVLTQNGIHRRGKSKISLYQFCDKVKSY